MGHPSGQSAFLKRLPAITSESEQETIRAVVLAYAEGKIELQRPKGVGKDGGLRNVRNAPSFCPASKQFNDLKLLPKPYNAESIAKFLGWMSSRSITAAIPHRGKSQQWSRRSAEPTRGGRSVSRPSLGRRRRSRV